MAEYARYFIGVSEFAAGIEALKRNWVEPARSDDTLAVFQKMARAVSPAMLRNWRFQQALYRAYFDAYSYGRRAGYVDASIRARIVKLAEALFQSIYMQLDVRHYKAESVRRGAISIPWT